MYRRTPTPRSRSPTPTDDWLNDLTRPPDPPQSPPSASGSHDPPSIPGVTFEDTVFQPTTDARQSLLDAQMSVVVALSRVPPTAVCDMTPVECLDRLQSVITSVKDPDVTDISSELIRAIHIAYNKQIPSKEELESMPSEQVSKVSDEVSRK